MYQIDVHLLKKWNSREHVFLKCNSLNIEKTVSTMAAALCRSCVEEEGKRLRRRLHEFIMDCCCVDSGSKDREDWKYSREERMAEADRQMVVLQGLYEAKDKKFTTVSENS